MYSAGGERYSAGGAKPTASLAPTWLVAPAQPSSGAMAIGSDTGAGAATGSACRLVVRSAIERANMRARISFPSSLASSAARRTHRNASCASPWAPNTAAVSRAVATASASSELGSGISITDWAMSDSLINRRRDRSNETASLGAPPARTSTKRNPSVGSNPALSLLVLRADFGAMTGGAVTVRLSG